MKDTQTAQPTTLAGSAQPGYFANILGAIGNTPLVKLQRVVEGASEGTILAKIEYMNPGGSVKDRIGVNIIEDAEQRGLLRPGGTIVEATSGNTGAGLAIAAAIKGYKTVFVMPDKMSEEKVRFLRALGARVIITPTAVAPEDPRSYYSVARRLASETPNTILANQYHNPANPESHYKTTGPELWEQTAGQIKVFVCGMGTGGTISGTGRYLKEKNPEIKIVGVDIIGSLLYETWKQGRVPEDPYQKTYKIEGIGEDFLPSTMDLSIVDEVLQVGDKESFLMTRRLVREEGIFCGGSAGSAVAGLVKSSIVNALKPGEIAVVLLPDSGDRYLSKVFDDNWMRENGFLTDRSVDAAVADVLKSSKLSGLITVTPQDQLSAVVRVMKTYDISQVPVVDEAERLVGTLTEVDLLDHLVNSEHIHDPSETIAGIINPNVVTVTPEDRIEQVMPAFERGKFVVVVEDQKPIGILTKIDIIDFLTSQIQ